MVKRKFSECQYFEVGQKVRLVYHPQIFGFKRETGDGVITKITPSGMLRIVGKTGDSERNELFYPANRGFAKGWNTLWFEEILGQ